jgi:hypothetical protein
LVKIASVSNNQSARYRAITVAVKTYHQVFLQVMEEYFSKFRKNIVGIDQTFQSPYGEKRIVYADWIASGRLYGPIEEKMLNVFGPFVANTPHRNQRNRDPDDQSLPSGPKEN